MPGGLFSGTMYATERRMSCIAKQGVCHRNISLNIQGRCLRLTIAHFNTCTSVVDSPHSHPETDSPQNRPTCVSICGIKFDLICGRLAGRGAGGSADPNPTGRVKGQMLICSNSSQIHPLLTYKQSLRSPKWHQGPTVSLSHTHTHAGTGSWMNGYNSWLLNSLFTQHSGIE